MQWNAYFAEAIAWQLLLFPAALIAAKVGCPTVKWWFIWLAAAALSWLVSITWTWALFPDKEFEMALARTFGWFTMLPLVGIFSGLWMFQKWRGSRVARVVAISLFVTAIALPIVACFRWIPEEEAKMLAFEELRKHYVGYRVDSAERTWDGWTVTVEFPNRKLYRVYLSRSGYCTGVGGLNQ
jgi:hypothetical protein